MPPNSGDPRAVAATRPAQGGDPQAGATALPHGGRLNEARRTFPGAPEPWLDLSTGINPHAYPLPAFPPATFARLPDPDDEERLRAAAGQAYGVRPDCVAAAPGTQILIGLLPHLFAHATIAVLGPTYGEHAAAWRAAGAAVVETNDPARLALADVAVLCTPNNPDGRVTPRADILRLAERAKLVIVDEAFADLEDAPSVAAGVPHPSVIVLRSFGKTYGLAGLRLGFALADPAPAACIRAAFGPWAVGGPALAAGVAALPDAAWRTAARARLGAEAVRLDAMLLGHGLSLRGGTRLFRLAASEHASAVHRALGQAGILVRRFAEHPSWLRFGIPADEDAWRRLNAALAQAVAHA